MADMMQIFAIALQILLFCTSAAEECRDDIRLPPTIVQPPQEPPVAKPADTIVLDCKAEGHPKVTHTWQRKLYNATNWATVSNGSNSNIHIYNNGSLVINKPVEDNAGHYQCVVENPYGKVFSDTIHVQVAIFKVDNTETANKEISHGDQLRIDVVKTDSFPRPTYTWQKGLNQNDTNTATVVLSDRIQQDANGNLYFANALPDDGRFYKVQTRNDYTDRTQGGSYTNVTVKQVTFDPVPRPPVLMFSLCKDNPETKCIAFKGDRVSLRCFFSGYPTPRVSWREHDIRRNKISKHETELIIEEVTDADARNYTCTGQNNAGPLVSHTMQIVLKAKPMFKNESDKLHDVNATEGDDVTFNCKAEGFPEPSVVWMKNGEPLAENSRPGRRDVGCNGKCMKIRNVNRTNDIMVIQCNASNDYGYVFSSGFLNVLNRTKVIIEGNTRVYVSPNMSTPIRFTPKVEYDCSTEVGRQWFKKDSSGLRPINSEELPNATVEYGSSLEIHLNPKDRDGWAKYLGEYVYFANSSYSNASVSVYVEEEKMPAERAMWPIWLLICLIILAIIVCLFLVCYYCYWRNKGEAYDVDKKERFSGNDPVGELEANDFHDYSRNEERQTMSSRLSQLSEASAKSTDDLSLNQYEDDKMGNFREDGSFVGTYGNRSKR